MPKFPGIYFKWFNAVGDQKKKCSSECTFALQIIHEQRTVGVKSAVSSKGPFEMTSFKH